MPLVLDSGWRVSSPNPITVLDRSFVLCHERCHDWTVVRADSPIGDANHGGLSTPPFPRHPLTQENVINAAVRIFLAVKMSPGDLWRQITRVIIRLVVAVLFGGSRINERVFTPGGHQGANWP